MLDLNNSGDLAAYEKLRKLCLSMSGTNFALAMRHEDGSINVYPRQDQPCQGGEMRKYKKTHPDDCTRPDDPRPGDLHHPFPPGIPEAVCVSYHTKLTDELRETLDEIIEYSPYKSLNLVGNTDLVSGKHTTLSYKDEGFGIIFRNTDVDSTLFVNFLQFLKSDIIYDNQNMGRISYKAFREYMPSSYASVATMLAGSGGGMGDLIVNDYYFPTVASVYRMVNSLPTDLTGGTFRDRYDYNRPEVQNLFKAIGDETKTHLTKLLSESGIYVKHLNKTQWSEYESYTFDRDEMCKKILEILEDAYHTEEKRLAELAA